MYICLTSKSRRGQWFLTVLPVCRLLSLYLHSPLSIEYLPVFPFLLHTGNLYYAPVSPAHIPAQSLCCCANKQILIRISRVTPLLVLLLALLTHASGPGTWHGHVEAPCCWEALPAGTLLHDWRRPGWDEWALYIEQEAWGTALVRPLSLSIPHSLFGSLSPSNTHSCMFSGAQKPYLSHHKPQLLFFSLYTFLSFVVTLTERGLSLNDLTDCECECKVYSSLLHAKLGNFIFHVQQ